MLSFVLISCALGFNGLDDAILDLVIEDDIEIRQINDIESLDDMVKNGQVAFVDARSAKEYAKNHLPGAVSIPLSDYDVALAQNLDLYSTEKVIVVYCSGEGCDLSDLLARRLSRVGLNNIAVFTGGVRAWINANQTMEQ